MWNPLVPIRATRYLWQVRCRRFPCEEEHRAVQEEDEHKRPTKKACCSGDYPEQQQQQRHRQVDCSAKLGPEFGYDQRRNQ